MSGETLAAISGVILFLKIPGSILEEIAAEILGENS